MFQGPSLSLPGVQPAASHFETALTANCIFSFPSSHPAGANMNFMMKH